MTVYLAPYYFDMLVSVSNNIGIFQATIVIVMISLCTALAKGI